MLFFLLPLMLNPIGLMASWLPAFYLAAWPIIIQTMGRETIMTHAMVLILYILTSEISRQTMLKYLGIDLISFPLGVALLASLATDKGADFIDLARPLFDWLLVSIEPVFLAIELYLCVNLVRKLNKWMSDLANERDHEAHDLSTWEPPLARTAIVARILIVLITAASYLGTYLIIQKSKSLLLMGQGDVPIIFNHAIAALVTLQLIALSATIYKEEGVLSESALITLLASVPLFIASWSYYSLKLEHSSSAGWWWPSNLFPFSIFGASHAADEDPLLSGLGAGGGPPLDPWTQRRPPRPANELLMDLLADIARQAAQVGYLFNGNGGPGAAGLVGGLARRVAGFLTKAGRSLGSTPLADYYFKADFWYVLMARLVCLIWWAASVHQAPDSNSSTSNNDNTSNDNKATSNSNIRSNIGQRRRALLAKLPISAQALAKILLVLAYTQMLMQQMDNRQLEASQLVLAGPVSSDEDALGAVASAGQTDLSSSQCASDNEASMGWFGCMWASACRCSSAQRAPSEGALWSGAGDEAARQSRFYRALGWLRSVGEALLGAALGLVWLIWQRLSALPGLVEWVCVHWLARWRSPIVQRLMQSVLVQLVYIRRLARPGAGAADDDDAGLHQARLD